LLNACDPNVQAETAKKVFSVAGEPNEQQNQDCV
jgi:hypothetical protein